jgi:hypothetical protein
LPAYPITNREASAPLVEIIAPIDVARLAIEVHSSLFSSSVLKGEGRRCDGI